MFVGSNPLLIACRNYGLSSFGHAGHSRGSLLYSRTMSVLAVPFGAVFIYTVYKNERRHHREMKDKEEFDPIYPREIGKLPWGNGKISFGDNLSNALRYKRDHETKVPRPAE